MKRLSSLGVGSLLLCLAPAASAGGSGADPTDSTAPATEASLVDFSQAGEPARWQVVNDGVMGGKSEGHLAVADGAATFHGEIVTRGGGFTSVRRGLEPDALAGATGLTMKVKDDGRGYRVMLRDGTRVSWGGEVMYAADVPAGAASACGDSCTCPPAWREVTLHFADLTASFHGRPADVEAFDPAEAEEIGVILADGIDGAFSMDLAWIRAER